MTRNALCCIETFIGKLGLPPPLLCCTPEHNEPRVLSVMKPNEIINDSLFACCVHSYCMHADINRIHVDIEENWLRFTLKCTTRCVIRWITNVNRFTFGLLSLSLTMMKALSQIVICLSSPGEGGGGGSLPLEVVPDEGESPPPPPKKKKHPKRGFNGLPKETLNKSHGPISTF